MLCCQTYQLPLYASGPCTRINIPLFSCKISISGPHNNQSVARSVCSHHITISTSPTWYCTTLRLPGQNLVFFLVDSIASGTPWGTKRKAVKVEGEQMNLHKFTFARAILLPFLDSHASSLMLWMYMAP